MSYALSGTCPARVRSPHPAGRRIGYTGLETIVVGQIVREETAVAERLARFRAVSMPDASDAELVAATRAGQIEAYGILVQRHQRRMYLALLRLCRDAAMAEDVSQDAFVRAHAALRSYDPSYPFAPWLHRIAVNLWRNRLRQTRREVDLDEGDEGDGAETWWVDEAPSPEVRAEAADLRRQVWAAVDALPEDARQIVILRHALELSYEEICAETGLAMGTVKSRLARARRELAEGLRGLVDYGGGHDNAIRSHDR
jgi:RNA polymerase sigma-70 factor, ECF subfamily